MLGVRRVQRGQFDVDVRPRHLRLAQGSLHLFSCRISLAHRRVEQSRISSPRPLVLIRSKRRLLCRILVRSYCSRKILFCTIPFGAEQLERPGVRAAFLCSALKGFARAAATSFNFESASRRATAASSSARIAFASAAFARLTASFVLSLASRASATAASRAISASSVSARLRATVALESVTAASKPARRSSIIFVSSRAALASSRAASNAAIAPSASSIRARRQAISARTSRIASSAASARRRSVSATRSASSSAAAHSARSAVWSRSARNRSSWGCPPDDRIDRRAEATAVLTRREPENAPVLVGWRAAPPNFPGALFLGSERPSGETRRSGGGVLRVAPVGSALSLVRRPLVSRLCGGLTGGTLAEAARLGRLPRAIVFAGRPHANAAVPRVGALTFAGGPGGGGCGGDVFPHDTSPARPININARDDTRRRRASRGSRGG